MDQASLFTNFGAPVSIDAINTDRIDDMSLGELAYAHALFGQMFSERLARPEAIHEIATYEKADGADWSGFTPRDGLTHEHDFGDAIPEKPKPREPVAPDNYIDSVPAIMSLMAKQERANEAAMANLTRLLHIARKDQTAYLGVPEGLRGFQSIKEIMRKLLRISGRKAGTIETRAKYVTYAVDADRTATGAAPKLPNIAASFAAGNIPGESLDRIIHFDADLTKYSAVVGKSPDYKDQVIQAFEPTMQEAAETASPEELTKTRQRWTEQVAHHIDSDGPPPTEALKKRPDNALHLRSHDDGTATASMHMDPVWAAVLKEFLNTNLNYKGNKPLLPENIENLYEAMANAQNEDDDAAPTDHQPSAGEATSTTDSEEASEQAGQAEPVPETQLDALHEMLGMTPEIDDRVPSQNEANLQQPVSADTVIAKDDQGNEYTRLQVDWLDKLTRPQRAGAILLGALYSVMSMHPDEAAAKRAHGSAAKLVIVQDIQTAHATLGLPPLPPAVQRPSGPEGLMLNVVTGPDPNFTLFDGPVDQHPPDYVRKVPWTQYQSEAVNVGPLHPKYTESLLCDAGFSGQIWNGHDVVLNEYREKRLFTTAQRKAILARDKGCQAPGCTVQGTYCQCHHIREWSQNGETNEANAITLCPAHHPDVHDGKWTIRKVNGVTYFQPARWLDPDQPLLRNLYWNI